MIDIRPRKKPSGQDGTKAMGKPEGKKSRKYITPQFTTDSMGHLLLLTSLCQEQRLAMSFDSFIFRGKMNWTCYVWSIGDEPVAKGRGETCGQAASMAYHAYFGKQSGK